MTENLGPNTTPIPVPTPTPTPTPVPTPTLESPPPPPPPSDFVLAPPTEWVATTEQAPQVSDIRFTAGVDILKNVLAILAVVLVLLLAYLAYADIMESREVNQLYQTTLEHLMVGELLDGQRVERVRKAIEGKLPLDAEAHQIRDTIATHNLLSSEQLTQLDKCVDATPADTLSDSQRQTCGSLLGTVEKSAPKVDLDRMHVLRDITKDRQDAHQSFRSFWLQAAQLILLNLLLPLLTGLLGYLFGTQGSSKNPPNKPS